MNEYRAVHFLHFSIFFLSPSSRSLFSGSLSRSVIVSLSVMDSLPSSLSLSYSDQMSNSCDAVAWLINALKEPREVEHNKQTGEGGKKRKRKDLREKPEEELVRMNMCVSMEILMLPFRLLHQVVWLSEGPFFFLISLSLFLILEKSCSVVLWGNELIINRKWKSKNTHTQVRQS